MTLSKTVQPAVSIMVSLPGSFASRTRTREDNRRQPARAEPSDEKLVHRTRSRSDQAQKDGKHSYHRQAEHCVEHRQPGDTINHTSDHDAAEHHPCQQRQRFTHVFGATQQLLLVARAEPAQQEPADKARNKPAAAAACAAAKHAAASATIGISTQCSPIQPRPSAKRNVKVVSQVNASPIAAPMPISSITTRARWTAVPPSI